MVKKMLEVVVNYLYPALTTVKTDWLFLCTPDSVMFAASRPLHPSFSVPFSSWAAHGPSGRSRDPGPSTSQPGLDCSTLKTAALSNAGLMTVHPEVSHVGISVIGTLIFLFVST